MKLSPDLNEALNKQVSHEFRNMLFYKQVESFFENLQLKKISEYFKNQANEEKEHAEKFIEYINKRTGGGVIVDTVQIFPQRVESLEDIERLYVLIEEQTTESIESIFDLAFSIKSYIDLGFLQEMLDIQVSEEDEANEFVLNLKNAKDLVLFNLTFG